MLAVLTAADATADGLKPFRPYAETNKQTGERFAFAPQPLLAHDKVRFAGEPVAPGCRRDQGTGARCSPS